MQRWRFIDHCTVGAGSSGIGCVGAGRSGCDGGKGGQEEGGNVVPLRSQVGADEAQELDMGY